MIISFLYCIFNREFPEVSLYEHAYIHTRTYNNIISTCAYGEGIDLHDRLSIAIVKVYYEQVWSRL